MTTTKSYSSRSRFFTIYKNALKNQLPMMVIFTILYFLSIALPLIVVLVNDGVQDYSSHYYLETGFYLAGEQALIVNIMASVMAVVLGLFANSYMHSKRMVDLYHAIPVARPQLLTANFLASMTTIIAPFLIVGAVSMGLQIPFLLYGYSLTPAYFWFMFQDIIGMVLGVAICYLFVTFVSVNVGTAFDTFAVSGVLGFCLPLIYLISGTAWSELAYGANFSPQEHCLLLSPFLFPFYKYIFMSETNLLTSYFPVGKTLLFLLACVVLAAVLFAVAVFFYNRRKSEVAEKTQASGVFQTIVKIVAAFLGGALLYLIFKDRSLVTRSIAILFGAVLIGIIAELILSRGIKDLAKNLKWLVGTGAACVLAVVFVSLDSFGYISRVPAVDSVASVSINYGGRFNALNENGSGNNVLLTEPDSISIVTSAHKATVEGYQDGSYEDYEQFPYSSYLTLTYTLKNGSTVSRDYRRTDKNAYASLANLEDKDDFIRGRSPLFLSDSGDADRVWTVESMSLSTSMRDVTTRLILSSSDQDRLMEAMRQDMLDESLAGIQRPAAQALGYVTVRFRQPEYFDSYMPVTNVVVTEEYARTIALLQEFGVYDNMVGAPITADKVYLASTKYYYYSEVEQVYAIIPSNNSDYIYESVYDYMKDVELGYGGTILTEDKKQVEQILAAARNQMLLSRADDNNTFFAVFCNGDTVIGHMLVNKGDLPQALQDAIGAGQRLDDDILYAEPVSMPVEDFVSMETVEVS